LEEETPEPEVSVVDVPIEISIADTSAREEVEELIREQAGRLDKVHRNLNSCRVAVDRPHRHERAGRGYRVRIDLTVPPGHEVVVRREPDEAEMHESLSTTIIEAFQVAQRRLRKLQEQQRSAVKEHPRQQVMALVEKILDGYGFLRANDGREIYFHRNSVLHPGFEELREGMGVSYVEEEGRKGPQASSLRVVDPRLR
jgi:cold shock CspA family protein/ribosome-associated translation inhibitor RaiA